MGSGRMGGWPDVETWPWAPRWVELAEGRLHYVREGSGARVVLVHGTPTWSYEWRHVIRGLAPSHEVIAVDHLGFGRSDRPRSAAYAPEAHAERFGRVMSALVPDGPVSLVVHDFGGPIALKWVLENAERVHRLVLVNTWMWPLDQDPALRRMTRLAGSGLFRLLYRYANASLKLVMPSAYGDRARLTREIHAQYLAAFPDGDSRERVLFALARSLAGSSAYYASLWRERQRLADVPVTIVWGMKDSALPPSLLERWQEAVPHAVVHRFEGAGHWPHEEAPEAFVEVLLRHFGASDT